MWAVVFFRCVCPFSAESGISVFNIFRLESADETDVPAAVVYELAESPSAVPEEAMQNILFSGEENAERQRTVRPGFSGDANGTKCYRQKPTGTIRARNRERFTTALKTAGSFVRIFKRPGT